METTFMSKTSLKCGNVTGNGMFRKSEVELWFILDELIATWTVMFSEGTLPASNSIILSFKELKKLFCWHATCNDELAETFFEELDDRDSSTENSHLDSKIIFAWVVDLFLDIKRLPKLKIIRAFAIDRKTCIHALQYKYLQICELLQMLCKK